MDDIEFFQLSQGDEDIKHQDDQVIVSLGVVLLFFKDSFSVFFTKFKQNIYRSLSSPVTMHHWETSQTNVLRKVEVRTHLELGSTFLLLAETGGRYGFDRKVLSCSKMDNLEDFSLATPAQSVKHCEIGVKSDLLRLIFHEVYIIFSGLLQYCLQ